MARRRIMMSLILDEAEAVVALCARLGCMIRSKESQPGEQPGVRVDVSNGRVSVMDSSGSEKARVALVTGAGQGVGLGIAQVLARSGLKVVLTDVNGEQVVRAAEELAKQGHAALGLTLDVTRAEHWASAVREVIDRFGRLDVLVNNAGISPRGTAESTDEELWDRTLAINLKGAWLGIKTALPWLKQTRGSIVNIGSTRATRPMPGMFSYCTSKSGLWGMTQQVAVEYLETGITCNMLAPGWVDTPGERIIQAAYGRPDFPKGTQNIVVPEEIGEAVAFLVSKAGHKVNGVTLYLDSGLHVADDAGMVYLPGRARPPYEQIPTGTSPPEGPKP
jgi:NAD(P)-dependent dehydrogenase (short-subunit alcohol dehydrogenase family)